MGQRIIIGCVYAPRIMVLGNHFKFIISCSLSGDGKMATGVKKKEADVLNFYFSSVF